MEPFISTPDLQVLMFVLHLRGVHVARKSKGLPSGPIGPCFAYGIKWVYKAFRLEVHIQGSWYVL